MDQFKIDHFRRSHPNKSFPHFNSLSDEETAHIRKRLQSRLALHSDDGFVLISLLYEQSRHLDDNNVLADNFNLCQLLVACGIKPDFQVYLNWYRLDLIDSIAFSDLSEHLNDIWYPSSDDIDIFDDTLTWVVMISHDGDIRLWKQGNVKDKEMCQEPLG